MRHARYRKLAGADPEEGSVRMPREPQREASGEKGGKKRNWRKEVTAREGKRRERQAEGGKESEEAGKAGGGDRSSAGGTRGAVRIGRWLRRHAAVRHCCEVYLIRLRQSASARARARAVEGPTVPGFSVSFGTPVTNPCRLQGERDLNLNFFYF